MDSWFAVHSYTGIQMWTLGLQSIAWTSTNKEVFRIIQAYQFFNFGAQQNTNPTSNDPIIQGTQN